MPRYPYFNPELARSEVEEDSPVLGEVIELLEDPRLKEEVLAGNVTLAMIRPEVGPDANLQGLTDTDAADRIEEEITGLGMMAKFSFKFTPAIIEEFYGGGPQESMLKEAPINSTAYDSRWPEFIDFMSSGPVTALLLYSENGDAIEKWRSHLGHWNIDKVRDESTIRGKFGVNKYNNLVHGSDSPESVAKELDIIKRNLAMQIEKSHE